MSGDADPYTDHSSDRGADRDTDSVESRPNPGSAASVADSDTADTNRGTTK